MKTKKHQKQMRSPAAELLVGMGICVLTFLAVMLLAAMMILTTKKPLANSNAFSPLVFAVAGLFSGWIGRKIFGKRRIFLFCPLLILLIALLIGLLLSGGRIALSALLSELIYLGASYLAFYIAKERSAKKNRRH